MASVACGLTIYQLDELCSVFIVPPCLLCRVTPKKLDLDEGLPLGHRFVEGSMLDYVVPVDI